ncbi:penicillin-binding protein 2 [Desulfosporosinus acidiphilus SJ4]|uniref:Penicillin-binding protein 2 n=1 Tax=Desulfosporosinus acidiphilus (strain DSM 22704 / JCM 16185 / SJ4) TaxID=646529 RepID=I4DBI1_DESAJ|nr:penicillin-binding protein 2 [Desulfosporosinus acidiphilus]AFM43155.1 penicillin-binding protein 2 [Desulfosporosinus acidiphilus SJ4]
MDDKERKPYVHRFWGLSAVVVIVFLILGLNLWHLQIAEGSYYSEMAKGNVMQLVKIPTTRGDIVDKNNKLLATSVPEFVLTLDWLDLQQSKTTNWKDVVMRLAGFIKPYWPNANETVDAIDVDILVNIQNHQWERYRPVTILENVPQQLQAVIAEHQDELPGVSVDATPIRSYPQHTLAGQILGYVREIGPNEIDQFNKNPDAQKAGFTYSQGDLVGKDGVEKTYDFWLRGKEGVQQVEVDNNARPLTKKIVQTPEPGKTIQLTIDADLQKTVEDSLDQVIANVQRDTNPNAKSGAAVVIDVNTGKILAMASRPSMDPNDLIGNISQQVSDKYFTNKDAPAASLNRALAGLYPPGSTFKMITAMAALQLKLTTPDEKINDVLSSLGNIVAQKQGFVEWGGNNFGLVNIYRALALSSDIYFEVVGRRVFDANPEFIGQIAHEFGLGTYTGVDLPGEAKGLVPSEQWKKANIEPQYAKQRDQKLAAINSKYAPKLAQAKDTQTKQKLQSAEDQEKKQVQVWYQQMVDQYVAWKAYDSYNNAIGQGYNDYTPLQLANYVATIVNGGKHYRPYIVNKISDPLTGKVVMQNQPKVENTVSISPDVLATVKQGMQAATTGEGTAAFLFSDIPDFSGGAKTGTAQTGSVNTSNADVYNGMFVAFAPYDHPQIAFAGVVEYGSHGGDTAGYVARAAFMKYFGWKSTNGG